MTVNRVGTGIRGLDRKLGGGFEKGSVTLLEGGPGSGKTLFGLQFAYDGLVAGENVLYISFDEEQNDLVLDMEGIGLNPKKYLDSGKLTFEFFSPPDFLQKPIDSRAAKCGASRLVLDSISPLMMYFKDEFTFRRFILDSMNKVKDAGITTMMTSGQDERTPEYLRMYSGEFIVDTLINMLHSGFQGEYDRAMRVIKMRRTEHERKLIAMKIDNNGISVK